MYLDRIKMTFQGTPTCLQMPYEIDFKTQKIKIKKLSGNKLIGDIWATYAYFITTGFFITLMTALISIKVLLISILLNLLVGIPLTIWYYRFNNKIIVKILMFCEEIVNHVHKEKELKLKPKNHKKIIVHTPYYVKYKMRLPKIARQNITNIKYNCKDLVISFQKPITCIIPLTFRGEFEGVDYE